jgi:Glycogen recognition site of AMP-activated protein kinase
MSAKATTNYEPDEVRREIEYAFPSTLNVRFDHFSPLNFQIKHAMKTTNVQKQTIPPGLFQIAARIDSFDSSEAPNRGQSFSKVESPTSKSRAAEGVKITFRLEAPSAHSVKLAADFTDWEKSPLKMTKRAKGVWETAVPLAAGHYSYRFIVDGEWHDDPLCPQRETNPFGTTNAVIHVS